MAPALMSMETTPMNDKEKQRLKQIKKRLEYLRGELRAERISWGELAELQGLVPHIDPDDLELLEAAGVPESETESGKARAKGKTRAKRARNA